VKRVCKPREEMPMQGMSEEQVVLIGDVVKVSVVDIGGE
jgi:hypothetical protein